MDGSMLTAYVFDKFAPHWHVILNYYSIETLYDVIDRHQAITWTDSDLLPIRPWEL